MSPVQTAVATLLTDDPPRHPDAAVWELLRLHLPTTGPVPAHDLRALVDLRTAARGPCPGFDEPFFAVLRDQVLADGHLSAAEQWAVFRMAYGGGAIDPAEWAFLDDLRQALPDPSPEFVTAYEQAKRDASNS